MEILTLTTYDAIRAVLGVDSDDISDTTLTDFDLEPHLKLDLSFWFPSYQGLIDKVGKSDSELLQISALEIYAKYFCANEVLISANMQFLQRKSDGEVESHRFQEDSLKELKDEFKERVATAKKMVLNLVTEFSPEKVSATPKFFSKSKPSNDVVTD